MERQIQFIIDLDLIPAGLRSTPVYCNFGSGDVQLYSDVSTDGNGAASSVLSTAIIMESYSNRIYAPYGKSGNGRC